MSDSKKTHLNRNIGSFCHILCILVIQSCFIFTNGAIDESKLVAQASKTSNKHHEDVLHSVKSIACPTLCVCEDYTAEGRSRSLTCREAGLKVFPTVPKDEILHAKWISSDTLDVSNNDLSLLPHGEPTGNVSLMAALGKNLKRIELHGNQITAIEDNTFLLNPNVEELNLERNRLTSISNNAFNGLTALKSLNLKNNHLNHLSFAAFKELPNLNTLDLTSNYFTEVPTAITVLKQLEKVYLSKNQITTIPPAVLQKCPELRRFEINGNPLNTVHHQAFVHLPKLEELRISEARGVNVLPDFNGTISLELLRFDRASIESIPSALCAHCPNLKSLELKGNKLKRIPELKDCAELRMLDLTSNHISFNEKDIDDTENCTTLSDDYTPFKGLRKLHDLHLGHNNISFILAEGFQDLRNLKVLDLSNNEISCIHDDAFEDLHGLEDLNLGENGFSRFPSKGLKNLAHIKVHNNPSLEEFPSSPRFPKIQTLVLSYAYHCCQFIPETFETPVPEYPDFGNWEETILFPGEVDFDPELWNHNATQLWTDGNKTDLSMWENLAPSDIHGFFGNRMGGSEGATPPPGIHCMPAPGPFLPCNDLFDWWSLRCSVWIVFLLALLGNGCVVIVLVASRGKMDVPRFLVCNLAMADFFMGLYLGFLAIVDASTFGEFRKYAIHWQFSPGCQVAGFFGVLSSELSVFTLAVITLERNYAITHAMHLNKRLSLKHAAYIMCGGWSFALIMASLPLFGVSGYWKYAVCLPFETDDALSLGYVVFLMLINGVAFSILMGCYLKMYCAIRGSQAWNSNDSRIAKRMALLVFTDFICWAPIAFFALLASFGVYLISLEQAKVFTIFVLPLNSCCNPFLYAILTKQFKKDCVMICKTIEESRVTRGIGRCRHSSNFSNRQTPANTNSLNSGSGTHGSHGHSKGTVCSCNAQSKSLLLGHALPSKQMAKYWPFKKIKKLFYGYKEGVAGGRGESVGTNSGYTHQIAEIQHKQRKTKRHASVSSDNFSSSRSDSWRHGGRHCIQGLQHGPGHHYRHRRRNSWTVTRKPSQDSQLSSSRNDSSSINSNSTNTWRMSRSSVSSAMSHSLGRAGSNKNPDGLDGTKFSALANARARVISKANAELSGTSPQGMASASKPLPLSRLASENASFMSMYGGDLDATGGKPKLTRQTAIMADGDSTCSGKSVTFKEPAGVGSARRFVAATTELGQCPLHAKAHGAAPKGQRIYNRLVVNNGDDEDEDVEEESDMEASDAEYNDGDGIEDDGESDGIPLGTTFRTVEQCRDKQKYNIEPQKKRPYVPKEGKKSSTSFNQSGMGGGRLREIGGAMVGFLPRKLSTISSSKEKDIAKSPVDDSYDMMEKAVSETTPLREGEDIEPPVSSGVDIVRPNYNESEGQVKKEDSPTNQTKNDGKIDTICSTPSKTNIEESEKTDNNTVIQPGASSQALETDKFSTTSSPEKELRKTDITSIRKQTEKAKARFLESDI